MQSPRATTPPPRPAGRAPSPRRGGVPARRCTVCRTPQPTLALVQLEPAAATAGGRRSYVCIALPCLRAGLGGGGRRPRPGGEGLVPAVAAMAEARLLALVGLARRCGVLVAGVDAAAALRAEHGGAPDAGEDATAGDDAVSPRAEAGGAPAPERPQPGGATLLLAADLSPRSAARLGIRATPFAAVRLGHAAGRSATGAVGIAPGRLAMQAAYWLRVWYATQHQRETG